MRFFEQNIIKYFRSQMIEKKGDVWVAWAIRNKRSVFFY